MAVDLAAKLSAACLMDDRFNVLHQVDSFDCTEDDFLAEITRFFRNPGREPAVMVVEDLPHGLKYSSLIKDVCRLQGRVYHLMNQYDCGDRVLFLSPAQWRSTYSGMERGTGPDVVLEVADRYGYQPPSDLETRTKGKGGITRAHKVATDYCSAYLIARWAIATYREHRTYDVVGTSRYRTRAITKKDATA